MDEDLDYESEDMRPAGNEFVEFVTKLSERNRTRQLKEQIERREESRRICDLLGIEGFELGHNY